MRLDEDSFFFMTDLKRLEVETVSNDLTHVSIDLGLKTTEMTADWTKGSKRFDLSPQHVYGQTVSLKARTCKMRLFLEFQGKIWRYNFGRGMQIWAPRGERKGPFLSIVVYDEAGAGKAFPK